MTLITGGGVLNKISLIVSIEAMVLLYLIGFIANIDFLVFKISPSSTEIALLPIAVGLLQDSILPEQMASKLICLTLGLIVIGLGTAIYLHANFAPIPVDRLMLIIQDLTGRSIFFSKTIIYIFFLVMAFIFNGPIGIGTLLTVCLGGPILNYFMALTNEMLSKYTI